MELELRHLRLIVTVAEQGSVTRAAASLGLTQPALTAQLNRIDRTLGAAVFTRDQRGARPTALGELVLGRAKVLLPAMSALVDDAHRMVAGRDLRARSVRVGTAATALGGLFVNRLVSGLHAEVTSVTMPDVDAVAAQLAAQTLDIALVGMCGNASPPTAEGVRWSRVSTDPVFVLVPDNHPLATRAVVTLTDLADVDWLGVSGAGCFQRCFVTACARAGFTPGKVSEADRAACVDLVRAGHGVALVQPTFPDTPGVSVVPLAGVPLQWAHHVGWHDESAPLPMDGIVDAALAAHAEAVSRSSPRFLDWLAAGRA
ncbi:LysR family transcriptional regulator [Cellulomonas humilata]|uniref:LysR family transcriptional regulator n=1 Tax=Cellulomonas humilata TaxID=144055 RepID=A0A7Y6A1H7_9CELL|nr:LysR family transcriptional regulator [Cellulomonas humilata]NUU17952.1 LysR family transcriptional regulator [Cellulomonas humilata]